MNTQSRKHFVALPVAALALTLASLFGVSSAAVTVASPPAHATVLLPPTHITPPDPCRLASC